VEAKQEAVAAAGTDKGKGPSREDLIALLQEGREMALQHGNVSGLVAVVKMLAELQGQLDEPAKVQAQVDAAPTDPRELCKVFMRLMADEGMMGEWRDMVRGIVLVAHAQLSEEAEGTGDEEAFRRFTGHQVADAILPPSEAATEQPTVIPV